MLTNAALRLIEERTGHAFKDADRLERALTHSSARAGNSSQAGDTDYERLEFLGDRVLGLVVAEMLFSVFPKADEGELSVRLNALVNAETCAAVADELGLFEFIRTGADVRQLADKRLMNLRADVMESLIAAIYLEGGLEVARAFILRHWQGRADGGQARRDPKTELQEWAHQQGGAYPVYVVESREGPDHDPLFIVKVTVGDFEPGYGRGRSKRMAEQEAAEQVLYRQGVWSRGSPDE